MAIKETTTYKRSNTSVLWLHDWHQSLPDPDSRSLVPTYGEYFVLTSSESIDGLSLEVIRLWNDRSKFIESRSSSSPEQVVEYFNYLLDNGITITRTTEQI